MTFRLEIQLKNKSVAADFLDSAAEVLAGLFRSASEGEEHGGGFPLTSVGLDRAKACILIRARTACPSFEVEEENETPHSKTLSLVFKNKADLQAVADARVWEKMPGAADIVIVEAVASVSPLPLGLSPGNLTHILYLAN